MYLTKVRHIKGNYNSKTCAPRKAYLRFALFFLFSLSDYMLYSVLSIRSFSSTICKNCKPDVSSKVNRFAIGGIVRRTNSCFIQNNKHPDYFENRNYVSTTTKSFKFDTYLPTKNSHATSFRYYHFPRLYSLNIQSKVRSTEKGSNGKEENHNFEEKAKAKVFTNDKEEEILSEKLNQIESQMFQLTGIPFNPNSFRDVSNILFDHLKYDTEVSYKGSNGIYSTNSKVLKLLMKQGHEFPKLMLEYRQTSSKISSLKKQSTETDLEIPDNETYDKQSRKRALSKLLNVVHSTDSVTEGGDRKKSKEKINTEGHVMEEGLSNSLIPNESKTKLGDIDVRKSNKRLKGPYSEGRSLERTENRYEELVLIDASGLIFRSYYAIPQLTRPDGQPINAVVGFISILLKSVVPLFFSQKNNNLSSTTIEPTRTRVLICFDSAAKCFRSDIDSNYKAHRKATPIDLTSQFKIIKAACDAFGIPSVEIPGFEADDIIATYATKSIEYMNSLNLHDSTKNVKKPHVTIMSSDKDLLQLVTEQISVLDPSKGIVYTPLQVQEKFKVSPNRFIDYLSMVGDSSDNIKGIPGVGPKTAVDFLNKFDSLDELIDRRTEIEPVKKRIAVIENIEAVLKARKLVTLEKDIPKLPLEIRHIPQPQIDFDLILEFLEENTLHDLGRRVKNIRKSIPEQSLKPQQPFGAGENEVPF